VQAWVAGEANVTGKADPRDLHEQLLEHDPSLDARKVRPQAEMDAGPKAEVISRVTIDDEPVRVGVLAWIAVGRAEQEQHPRARGDRRSADTVVSPGSRRNRSNTPSM
jgi:hypothetical protein